MIAARAGKSVAAFTGGSSSMETAPQHRAGDTHKVAELKKDRRLQGGSERRPAETVAMHLENERQNGRCQCSRYESAGAEAEADKRPGNRHRQIPDQDDVPCYVRPHMENRTRHNRGKDGPDRSICRLATSVVGWGGI